MTHVANEEQASEQRASRTTAGQVFRVLPAAIVVVALAVLAVANTQQTKIHLVFRTVQAPLFAVLLISAVAGGLLASLLRLRRHHLDR
jgi:uncharacterized integral membrane protein